jgi:DNA invertase Pin-like site-specific DNA recombinase
MRFKTRFFIKESKQKQITGSGRHKMLIGYARVSTEEQSLEPQLEALKEAGCEEFFQEVASGAKTARPQLEEAIKYARKGDVIVVWKLDRLGRSLKHLIETIQELEKKGVEFKSLTEGMDTKTSGGRLLFNIFGAIAEFEKDLIKERTQAGLKAARARGRKGGRPKKMDAQMVEMARSLHKNANTPVADICRMLKISKSTLYRCLKYS